MILFNYLKKSSTSLPLLVRRLASSEVKQVSSLYDFFELKKSLPIYDYGQAPKYGRAWKADELRLKSFDDLHKLWWVLIKERNMLSTQKAEAQRLGQRWFGVSRVHKVKLAMSRIKTILLERQRLYNQAKHLVEIKKGLKPTPTGGDLLITFHKKDRLRLAQRTRSFRKNIRHRRQVHPLY